MSMSLDKFPNSFVFQISSTKISSNLSETNGILESFSKAKNSLAEYEILNISLGDILTLHTLGNFTCLICRLLIFFFKIHIFSKIFRNTIRVSNSLDPSQARHFVGPDLGPNW